MNNLYAQYGAVDFEPTFKDGWPSGFHALFYIFGAEASLDSSEWWDAEEDMAALAALIYAEVAGK